MNFYTSLTRLRPSNLTQRLLAVALLSVTLQAAAQPAQKALLTSVSGAKPNLMITVDNSGSMAFPYPDSYNIQNDNEYELRWCPAPYSNTSSTWSFATGIGGQADYSGGDHRCYSLESGWFGSKYTVLHTNVSQPYSPARQGAANWSAQRSSNVNPIYYDPSTRYLPRVDSSGIDLVPTDGLKFVSNQSSIARAYIVYRNGSVIQPYHSMYPSETGTSGNSNNPNPLGFGAPYQLTGGPRIPTHIAYPNPKTSPATGAPGSTTPAFTYATCSDITTDVNGNQTGCKNATRVDVKFGSSATISLPAGHNRTDCTGNTCTTPQEIENILNWYRYYSTRAKASATAIGQALANKDFENNIRLGYMNINRRVGNNANAITLNPGDSSTPDLDSVRGVRLHELGGADTTQFYKWLYNHLVMGGTPLHNSIDRVANYYSQVSGVTEKPWATNPTAAVSKGNPEMSCRRSFNLLFSDGAWTANSTTNSGENSDETDTPAPGYKIGDSYFRYKHEGENTLSKRLEYTPYSSASTGGLADLSAKYFWHSDMSALPNEIKTSAGQPTFWQNMTTYTVGYMIEPSGELTGVTSGLTFADINKYKTQYQMLGYASAAKPSWPTTALGTSSTEQTRVDDFIQAGYTGGGKGYSAKSANEVRRVFELILSDVLGASGKDAGVSVSSNGSDASTTADRLKYGVSYRTLDNSGEVSAFKLDDDGKVVLDGGGKPKIEWVASNQIPDHNLREVFTMSGRNTAIELKGKFSDLSSDVQNSIKQGPDAGRVANDESFVNYLRGLDPVADAYGVTFRARSTPMGAMVNPPSAYLGGQSDSTYDLHGDVEGAKTYRQFTDRKRAYPASLFVATNGGVMHALNAKEGNELSAVMPRRSLKRMLHYADEAYTFEYVLDGPLSQHDVHDKTLTVSKGEEWKQWKHVAIGTGGRGEPLIYAVNSPMNKGSSKANPANRKPGKIDFLWETGPDEIDSDSAGDLLKMGYISNPLPLAGQTFHRDSKDVDLGKWIVLANSGHYNGYGATGKRAGLVVLDPITGEVIKRLPLPSGANAGRGLSGVTVLRDTEGSNRIVGAYAGDANGNLWKFNINGPSSTWGVAYGGKPLFTTPNNRPIYGAPAWQLHPDGGFIVVAATGIMLEESDRKDTAIKESIYGIWDPTPIGEPDASPFTTVAASELLEQSVTVSTATLGSGATLGNTYYKTTANDIDWKIGAKGTHRGWRLPLGYISSGERSIAEVQNLRSSVMVSTTVLAPLADPTAEMCTGTSLPGNYVYLLNALDGKHTKGHDINGDRKLDDYAVAYLPNGGFSRGVSVIPLIKKSDEAIIDPNDPDGDIAGSEFDPKVALSDKARETARVNEAGGESITQKCSGDDIRSAQGTADDGIWVGVSCPSSGWNRTQYQLSSPPSI